MKKYKIAVGLILLVTTLTACEKKQQPHEPVLPGELPTRNYGKPAWGPTDWILFGHTPYNSFGQPIDSSGLWLIRPDGTNKQPFTLLREVGDFDMPDWSPDGQWLALNKDAQIYKITVTKDSLVQLTTDPLRKFHPSWSPDGKWIAFSAGAGDPNDFGIWVVNVDGTEVRHIRRVDGLNPDWSPDGDKICFVGWPTGTQKQKLMIMEASGRNVQVIFDPSKHGNNETWSVDHPSFSLDGRRIILQMNSNENRDAEIWVMNIDGSNPRKLVSNGGREPSWSPDGRRIVYTLFSYRNPEQTGNGKLWIMDANGKNKRQFTF